MSGSGQSQVRNLLQNHLDGCWDTDLYSSERAAPTYLTTYLLFNFQLQLFKYILNNTNNNNNNNNNTVYFKYYHSWLQLKLEKFVFNVFYKIVQFAPKEKE